MKTFFMSGVIGWDVDSVELIDFLVEAKGEDVMIVINSPGGFVFDGFEIFNALADYTGNITIVMNAFTASIASYIAAVPNVKRICRDNTVWMHHNAWGCACGDYRELRKASNISESMSSIIARAYVKISKKKLKEIKDEMNEETWLFGKEIVDAGFADELIPADKPILGIEFSGKEKEDEKIMPLEMLSKEESIQTARANYELAKTKATNNEKYDLKRMAALVGKEELTSIKVEDNINTNEEEVEMTLQEFLQNNPEAKAEYDSNMASAKQEGLDQNIMDKIEVDTKNILQILDISGTKISDTVRNCIEKNLSVSDFAVQELTNQQKRNKESAQDVGNFGGNSQTPKDTAPEIKSAEEQKKSNQENAMNKGLDNYFGKKNKEEK